MLYIHLRCGVRKTKTRIYKSTEDHTIKTRCIHSPGNTTARIFSNGLHSVLFFSLFLPIISLDEKTPTSTSSALSSTQLSTFSSGENLFFTTFQPTNQHDESEPHFSSNKQPPSERRQSRSHLHWHTEITTCYCTSRNDNRAVGDSFSWTTV